MAYAINREEIINKAQFGYVDTGQPDRPGAAGPEGLAAEPASRTTACSPSTRPRRPRSSTHAGYKKGADGKFLSKDGQPMEFTFLVQSGWTDWIQAAQIIQAEPERARASR